MNKSPWSAHFQRIDANFSQCVICENKIATRESNTSKLKAHLQRHHRKQYDECSQATEAQATIAKKSVRILIRIVLILMAYSLIDDTFFYLCLFRELYVIIHMLFISLGKNQEASVDS